MILPLLVVTDGVLKVWFKQNSQPKDARKVSSAEELENLGFVHEVADANPSPYKLCQALRARTPPILASDGVAKEWFRQYRGSMKYVHSAGDLEKICGDVYCESSASACGMEYLSTEVSRIDFRRVVSGYF